MLEARCAVPLVNQMVHKKIHNKNLDSKGLDQKESRKRKKGNRRPEKETHGTPSLLNLRSKNEGL